MVENRFVGIKSRGVYESPGVTILMHGHRAVEQLTLDRELLHLRDSLVPRYAEMVYNGFWFAPEREALQAMIDKAQENVSGVARLSCTRAECGSPACAHRARFMIPTWRRDELAAISKPTPEGFIRLALRLRLKALSRVDSKKD